LRLDQIVEAVLFASDAPLNVEEIARADESLNEDRVEEAIQDLRAQYEESERAFQVVELGEGYQILTRPEFAPYLERFDTVPRPSRLSGPALETLAIIAYRQPIGRIEIEYIRGVSSAGVIHTLQDRALVEVVGRGEGIGRPLLYGTTQRFLEHFGFKALEDLPRPEELPVILRDRTPLEDLVEESEGEEEAVEEGGEPPVAADTAVDGASEVEAPAESAEAKEESAEATEEPTEETAASAEETGNAAEETGEPADEVVREEDAPVIEPEVKDG
jgi:segregation and condensation protein B